MCLLTYYEILRVIYRKVQKYSDYKKIKIMKKKKSFVLIIALPVRLQYKCMYHDVKWMLIIVTDLPCTLHKNILILHGVYRVFQVN